jgi:hypothetical protein
MAKRISKRESKIILKEKFFNEMLPSIKEKYEVIEYPHFIKIFFNNQYFDYYPGGQKLFRCTSKPTKKDWKEISINDFYNKLMC